MTDWFLLVYVIHNFHYNRRWNWRQSTLQSFSAQMLLSTCVVREMLHESKSRGSLDWRYVTVVASPSWIVELVQCRSYQISSPTDATFLPHCGNGRNVTSAFSNCRKEECLKLKYCTSERRSRFFSSLTYRQSRRRWKLFRNMTSIKVYMIRYALKHDRVCLSMRM